ncbi:MAG: hypothetical protein ACTSO7_06510 [Candidatus Heimdallarchaeota archaeon]
MASEKDQEIDEIEEGEIDLSSLTSEEKDALILEMQAEEMMGARQSTTYQTETGKTVRVKRKRRRKKPAQTNIAPGFGRVAIKMGTAMTFSMTFIFLGPLFIFMALFQAFGERGLYDWYDLLFGVIGVGLVISSIFLFRYLVKD